jgi:hypothetical protein
MSKPLANMRDPYFIVGVFKGGIWNKSVYETRLPWTPSLDMHINANKEVFAVFPKSNTAMYMFRICLKTLNASTTIFSTLKCFTHDNWVSTPGTLFCRGASGNWWEARSDSLELTHPARHESLPFNILWTCVPHKFFNSDKITQKKDNNDKYLMGSIVSCQGRVSAAILVCWCMFFQVIHIILYLQKSLV